MKIKTLFDDRKKYVCAVEFAYCYCVTLLVNTLLLHDLCFKGNNYIGFASFYFIFSLFNAARATQVSSETKTLTRNTSCEILAGMEANSGDDANTVRFSTASMSGLVA